MHEKPDCAHIDLKEHTHMYQKTIVIGHLGKDPEMRYTPTGVPVTSFNIATTRKWTNQNGETSEKTTWFRVTCWRKTAELAAQYLKKGRLVLVEGDIDASAFTDREGNPRASLELTATNVRFMGGGREEGAGGPGAVPAAAGGDDFPQHEDDLPF
jgi:single-strand DNA-binding protein